MYRLLLVVGFLLISACVSTHTEINEHLYKAVEEYFGVKSKSVNILNEVGEYAWIKVNLLSGNETAYEGGGGVGVAQQRPNGAWRIIFIGNGFPSCHDIDSEIFPLELDVQCEEDGKLLRLPTREVVNSKNLVE